MRFFPDSTMPAFQQGLVAATSLLLAAQSALADTPAPTVQPTHTPTPEPTMSPANHNAWMTLNTVLGVTGTLIGLGLCAERCRQRRIEASRYSML